MSVNDDIGDETHNYLDETLIANPVFWKYIDAGTTPPEDLLLSILVGQCAEKMGGTYARQGQARRLLEDHPEVKDLLREAWNSRSFKKIRLLSGSLPPLLSNSAT